MFRKEDSPMDYPTLSEEIELDEENIELLTAIATVVEKAGKDMIKHYVEPILASREDLRSRLKIIRAEERCEDFISILAVDSTWSKPSLELVIGRIAVIVAGYIVTTPMGIGSYGISSTALRRSYGDNESDFDTDVELEAKIMEFGTALKKTGKEIDMVMVDGSLYFSTIPEFFEPADAVDISKAMSSASGSKLASIASTVLVKLIRKVNKLNIPIVGVVKRVTSRFFLPYVAKFSLPTLEEILRRTNDKFLMSYILEPKEYVILDSYLDTLKEYLSYLHKTSPRYRAKKIGRVLEALERCYGNRDQELGGELFQELCNYMDNTSIVFYRQANDALYPQAIRLDVYPKTLLSKVLNYVTYNTSQNSVPIPLDYVDRHVRIEASAVKKMYGLLRSYINDSRASIAFGLTNPQKHYLYELG